MTGPLTRRRVTVVAGRARGHSIARIAADLGLTVHQVKNDLREAAAALGCPGVGPVVIDAAYRAGWLRGLVPEDRPPMGLSDVRTALLRGIAEGLTERQLAKRLGRSENTVHTNTRFLLRALDARNREHAVALAHQHGYFDALPVLDGLRVRFGLRMRVRGGNAVHAWDGTRAACSPGFGVPVALDSAAGVSCLACCTRLHLEPAAGRVLEMAGAGR